MEPLYKGQVGDGSFVPYTVEPLYKGQVGMGPLSLIQWSLSTRDKLRTSPLSFIQWSLSIRDKLGVGPLSLELREVRGPSLGEVTNVLSLEEISTIATSLLFRGSFQSQCPLSEVDF